MNIKAPQSELTKIALNLIGFYNCENLFRTLMKQNVTDKEANLSWEILEYIRGNIINQWMCDMYNLI